MNIRTYQPGDEAAQTAIYNEAAADLPRFKPATEAEITRRCKARDFDPTTRFFAEAGGRVVAYSGYHANGRVSFPWCRKGHEDLAGPLFEHVLRAMKDRRLTKAFAAYRGDWKPQTDFFLSHGFRQAREMVNFVLDTVEMPTRTGRLTNALTPLRPDDLPAVFALAPEALRVHTPEQLGTHLLRNPYFPPEAVFVLRSRSDEAPLAAGILVDSPTYADPKEIDASMPCFRLGAFGTEGMQVKRVNGLFSFVARNNNDLNLLALELMQHAANRLEIADLDTLAAQVPSDVPHLLRLYQHFFRRQGAFPVFERPIS